MDRQTDERTFAILESHLRKLSLLFFFIVLLDSIRICESPHYYRDLSGCSQSGSLISVLSKRSTQKFQTFPLDFGPYKNTFVDIVEHFLWQLDQLYLNEGFKESLFL